MYIYNKKKTPVTLIRCVNVTSLIAHNRIQNHWRNSDDEPEPAASQRSSSKIISQLVVTHMNKQAESKSVIISTAFKRS